MSPPEQGANVIGIDVGEPALEVARIRSQLHDLDLRFVRANATNLEQVASRGVVDALSLFAVMEHMAW